MDSGKVVGSDSMIKPRFDPTINLGHILTSLVLVSSVFLVYMDVIRTTDKHQMDITQIKDVLVFERAQAKENKTTERAFQAQVLNSIAEIREKMVSIETRMSISFPDRSIDLPNRKK